MGRKKIKRKTRPVRPPTPSPDVFEQALNTKAFGKYKTKTFRYVIEHDLAWLHWIYRQKLAQADMRSPGDLKIMLLCRHYPMGLGDAAERELAAGLIPQPIPVAEAAGGGDDGEEDDEAKHRAESPPPARLPKYVRQSRHAFEEGYTPDHVNIHLAAIAKYVSLPLAVVWDKFEDGSCGGDSQLVIIGNEKYAYECPPEIIDFLMGDESDVVIRRNMMIDFDTIKLVNNVAPIKIDKFNYVWRNIDSEREFAEAAKRDEAVLAAAATELKGDTTDGHTDQ